MESYSFHGWDSNGELPIFVWKEISIPFANLDAHFKYITQVKRWRFVNCQVCGRPTLLHEGPVDGECDYEGVMSKVEANELMRTVWQDPVLVSWRSGK